MPKVKFCSALFAFIFLTFAVHAHAQESELQGTNSAGERVFVIQSYEDGFWKIQTIVQHADGWQDVISKQSFSSPEAASVAQQTQVANLNPTSISNWAQVESSARLSGGTLWPTTAEWTWDWELKFAEWIQREVNTGFMMKYGIATDCADVAYATRWIFARMHGLPAANRLSGSKSLFTNESLRKEWKGLATAPEWFNDQRFLKALDYLLENTYTHTVGLDSYPVAINADHFLPGVFHLNKHTVSGHVQLVQRTSQQPNELPFIVTQSTTPRQKRELMEGIYLSPEQPKVQSGGFLRFLWPIVKRGNYSFELPKNMPGYSLEQYDPGFIREAGRGFALEVYLRLNSQLNFLTLFKASFSSLYEAFQARVTIVKEGYAQCQNRDCAEGSALYEAWSTPSRDASILQIIHQIMALQQIKDPLYGEAMRKYFVGELMRIAVTVDGRNFTLKSAMFIWTNHMYKSDPRLAPGLRWSLAPQDFATNLSANLKTLMLTRKKGIAPVLDETLRLQLQNSKAYCKNFFANDCAQLTMELERDLEIEGKTRPLADWLERTLWLNSDPKQTLENRWGALQEQSKSLELDPKDELSVTSAAVAFLKKGNGETTLGILKTTGLEAILAPQGFKWQHLDRSTQIATAISPRGIYRLDTRTGIATTYPGLTTDATRIFGLDGGKMLIVSRRHLWKVEFSQMQTRLEYEADLQSFGVVGSELATYRGTDGRWVVLDLRTNLAVVSAEGLLAFRPFYQNAKNIFLRSENEPGMILEKSTGKVLRGFDFTTITLLSPGGTMALIHETTLGVQGTRIVTLDQDFSIANVEPSLRLERIQQDFAFLKSSAESELGSVWHFQNENFVPVTSVDRPNVKSLSGPVYSSVLVDGKRQLRLLDGNKMIYEGPRHHEVAGTQTKVSYLKAVRASSEELDGIVPINNPLAPALMTGRFFEFKEFQKDDNFIDRGVVLHIQGMRYWFEFP